MFRGTEFLVVDGYITRNRHRPNNGVVDWVCPKKNIPSAFFKTDGFGGVTYLKRHADAQSRMPNTIIEQLTKNNWINNNRMSSLFGELHAKMIRILVTILVLTQFYFLKKCFLFSQFFYFLR